MHAGPINDSECDVITIKARLHENGLVDSTSWRLDGKLLRDVRRMWAQLTAAALVMSCGIATLTMSLSTLYSLQNARETYYGAYRFPHVFAHVKRAAQSLVQHIGEIPGVSRVQARIVVDVNLDVEGLAEPAIGRLISIPDRPPFGMLELHVRQGRLPKHNRGHEVVASESFVEAHGLKLGSTVRAVINGRLDELEVVGVALSPEPSRFGRAKRCRMTSDSAFSG